MQVVRWVPSSKCVREKPEGISIGFVKEKFVSLVIPQLPRVTVRCPWLGAIRVIHGWKLGAVGGSSLCSGSGG